MKNNCFSSQKSQNMKHAIKNMKISKQRIYMQIVFIFFSLIFEGPGYEMKEVVNFDFLAQNM